MTSLTKIIKKLKHPNQPSVSSSGGGSKSMKPIKVFFDCNISIEGPIGLKWIEAFLESLSVTFVVDTLQSHPSLHDTIPTIAKQIYSALIHSLDVFQLDTRFSDLLSTSLNRKWFSAQSLIPDRTPLFQRSGSKTWEFTNSKNDVLVANLNYRLIIEVSEQSQREILRSSGFFMMDTPTPKEVACIDRVVVKTPKSSIQSSSFDLVLAETKGFKDMKTVMNMIYHESTREDPNQAHLSTCLPSAPPFSS